MAKIAAQPAAMPAKNMSGSAKIRSNEQVQRAEGAGFTVALKNILTQKQKAGGNVSVDIDKLLVGLLSNLKQFSKHKGAPDKTFISPEKAAHIIQLLNGVIKHLHQQKEGLSDSVAKPKKSDEIEHDLKEFVWAVGQFQKLLNSIKVANKQQGQVDVQHLVNRLLETIDHLLKNHQPGQRSTAIQQILHSKQPAGHLRNGFSSLIRDGTKQIEPLKSETEPGDPVRQSRHSSTAASMKMMSPKDIAVSTFRRSVITHEKNGQTGHVASFDSGPMNRLQQFVIHVRGSGKGVTQQQFVRDFQQILAKSTLTAARGKEQLTVNLYPRHLGTLNIQLTRENGQLTATLIASTTAAKNLVETHLHQLQGAFASQNLHVDKLQVFLPSGQAQAQVAYDHGESRGQAQHGHREERQEQTEEDSEGDTSFTEWLKQLHLI